jgi:subtilase family serine protease
MPGNVAATFTATDTSGRDANSGNNSAAANLAVVNSGTTINPTVPVIGNGPADLLVQIVQVGVLNSNNQFVSTGSNTFRAGERVAVKFNVVNQGQTTTGSWNFRAELSDNSNRVYENPQYEAGIPAGGKATYTIAFDNIRIGSNTISIFADSMNQVQEFNESNNVGAISFNVNY